MCNFMDKLKEEEAALEKGIAKMQSDLDHTRSMMEFHQRDSECADHQAEQPKNDGIVIPEFLGNVLSQDMKLLLQSNPQETFTCKQFKEILGPHWKKKVRGKTKFNKKVSNSAVQLRNMKGVESKRVGKHSYMRWGAKPSVRRANG